MRKVWRDMRVRIAVVYFFPSCMTTATRLKEPVNVDCKLRYGRYAVYYNGILQFYSEIRL